MLPGDTVSLLFPMFQSQSPSLAGVHIKNLIFNGNRSKYNLNFDWRVNPTISMPSTDSLLIEGCRFEEIPTENIFMCGATLKDCYGSGFNGSVVHLSCDSGEYHTEILYNQFTSINEVGDALMEHSEAGITFSAKVKNLRMAYNRLIDIKEYGVGIFGNDDRQNEITDNLLDSEKETIKFNPFYNFQASNLIYNNKNPRRTDHSTDNCWVKEPQIIGDVPCQFGNPQHEPLQLGDTLTLQLDSFQVRISNENYLKSLVPLVNDTFFELVSMEISTSALSQFHSWRFGSVPGWGLGLTFDNGHRNGIWGAGNWGFGPCGEVGNCRELALKFIVRKVPDPTEVISCPLLGIQVIYDHELGTWEQPVICKNEPVILDPASLGKPIFENAPLDIHDQHLASDLLSLYPNPTEETIQPVGKIPIPSDYQIFDAYGRKIQTGIYKGDPIPVHELQSGNFWIVIRSVHQANFAAFTKI
jgi:hypothetical protein